MFTKIAILFVSLNLILWDLLILIVITNVNARNQQFLHSLSASVLIIKGQLLSRQTTHQAKSPQLYLTPHSNCSAKHQNIF